ncbi:nucleotide-binding protein [Mesorhizobium sp. M0309]|uniref:TIR domain-containing protein n=1 Tax=Mesorhizobium sp. M0309 TaxID=2956933 RepID=UPI003337C63C
MAPKIKPSVFIGSSSESLRPASTLQDALDYDTESIVWHQDGFPPSKYPLEALEKHLDRVDFAVFLFTPDDVTLSRGEERNTVRDNVLFELGLFIGRLTRSRTFIVKPRGVQLDLPSDLYGITPIEYEPARTDDNILASLGPVARKILELIRSVGPRVTGSEVGRLESTGGEAGEGAGEELSNSDSVTLNEQSERSEYGFAYWLATGQKNPLRQREVDRAFRDSKLNDLGESLAEWEASTAYIRMARGEPATLQSIRDQVAKFPNSARLHRTLGDALSHHGDAEGALRSYSAALDLAATIREAAPLVTRLLEAVSKSGAAMNRSALRSQLLTLSSDDTNAEKSFGSAMRSLAESAGLSQISQAIDEVRIKQVPDDSGLKFNVGLALEQGDADLSMLHYESIPTNERNATAWNNLGVAYSNLQMPGLAVSAYEMASKKGETIADGNLANKLIQEGFFEKARELAENAIATPNHHNNVVIALSSIDEAKIDEEKKRSAAQVSAENKQRFIWGIGYAALKPGAANIVGTWQTPEGILEISPQADGSLIATGEYSHERGANALGLGSLFQPRTTMIEKTIVSARLERFGDAFEGTMTRKPREPSQLGLLGSHERQDQIALYPIGTDALQVCIRSYEREQVEWRRVHTTALPVSD